MQKMQVRSSNFWFLSKISYLTEAHGWLLVAGSEALSVQKTKLLETPLFHPKALKKLFPYRPNQIPTKSS